MLELIDGRDITTPVHISRPRAIRGEAEPAAEAARIVEDVRLRGDAAVIEHTARLDHVTLDAGLRVDPSTVARSRGLVRPELVDALEVMAERLRSTCERQLLRTWMDRSDGGFVGELVTPLRRAGVYAPGGRAAYCSTVVMAVVPAQVAGVEGIAVASPPGPGGDVPEAILAACAVTGVDEVYRMGGAQAIAALAYGTETVRPVDKIVGPGNAYVAGAKRAVSSWVGTDFDAGPTELAIVADESADVRVLASDLVAQAEHGPHGAHVLVTWVPELLERVLAEIELAVSAHEHPDDVENALIEGGRGVLVRDAAQAIDTVNLFAPEHLQLVFTGALDWLESIRNAGALFVGPYSPVAAGDYAAGTNHILPTGGAARWASGLSALDFLKRTYLCGLEKPALERLAGHIEALATSEGLHEHARSVQARLAPGRTGGTR